jgi:ankyrin repeat protein
MRALVRAGTDPDALDSDRYDGTALIESVVLGDGGARHTATLKALVDAGADVNRADRGGTTPLQLALCRNYLDMAAIL